MSTQITTEVQNPIHSVMSNKQYNARTKYYLSKAKMEKVDFENYLFNAVKRYVETGDATHLNNAITGARNVGRLLQTLRVLKPVGCHKYDKATKLFDTSEGSKANKAKLKKLRDGETWAQVFDNALINDAKTQTAQAEREFNEEAVLRSLQSTVKKLAAHGVPHGKIMAAVGQAEQAVKKEAA